MNKKLRLITAALMFTVALAMLSNSAYAIQVASYVYLDQKLVSAGTVLEVYNADTGQFLTSAATGLPYEGYCRFTVDCGQTVAFDLQGMSVELYAVSGQSASSYYVPCETNDITLMFREVAGPEPPAPPQLQDLFDTINTMLANLQAWFCTYLGVFC